MEIYRTTGTCCREIIFEVDEDNILKKVKFINGCSGNLQGIAKLTEGKNIDTIIKALEGIQCRNGTSCPDQFAQALKNYRHKKAVEKSVSLKNDYPSKTVI